MKTLVIGNLYVDVKVNVDELPKTDNYIVCKKDLVTIGGCAYNVATILKNFGIEHELLSPIGNGTYGNMIRKEITNSGYKVNIEDKNGDNGYRMCLVDSIGEKSFITVKGIESIYKKSWFDNINSDEYENIYISGYDMQGDSGIVIANWLSKLINKNIFFAPGSKISSIDKDVLYKIFSLNPIVHINKDDALKFTNKKSAIEAARAINKITRNTVFITLGKNGVMCASNCEYRFIDSFKVKVVNTIGAADSHIGAIISAYSRGYSLVDCCYLANKVASKIVGIEESRLERRFFDISDYDIKEYTSMRA